MQSIEYFFPLLAKPHKAVITMHQKPDGDAMGSTLGLYHFLKALGHEVVIISPTNWASFLNWMPDCNKVIDYEANKEKSATIVNNADWLFCLDFNVLHRTKNMEQLLTQAKCVKILIDHHQQPQEEAFNYGVSDTAKSSTCEMVYDFIAASGYADKLDVTIATCLYTGIMTDTGSFRFPGASAHVHRIVAHFKDLGLQHSPIHQNIYDSSLENRLRLLGNALLNRMEILYEYNTAIMVVPKSDLLKFDAKTGDTEGLVNYLLSIQGIKMGALVIDRDEERKWSFRSKDGFDVNAFAREHFEGGGHKNAAGGRSSDSLDVTVRKFKQVIQQYEAQLQ
ncbi:DHH family phosphoesterase [Filimonas lacunae]|nr:bifunctional oligoribonuclease/PAP phosphatase NrnA [Filimonas lacunae]BAV08100.1 3'-to-5' oligoribonuclease A, Bacillus type [Filimonas lacunae]